MLLPTLKNEESVAFAKSILGAISNNSDLMETADRYIAAGGDIIKTATSQHCHQNTVRYRLGRIRDLTGLRDVTDSELYLQLKTALIIDRAAQLRKSL